MLGRLMAFSPPKTRSLAFLVVVLLGFNAISMLYLLTTQPEKSDPLRAAPARRRTMELEQDMEEGSPVTLSSEGMAYKELRVDFFDTHRCPQSRRSLETTCPQYLACSGEASNLAFCRNPQWNEEGIDKIRPKSSIYHLPLPVFEHQAHAVRATNMFVSSTGHLFDQNYRYYRGGCSEVERPFEMNQTSKVVKFDEVIVMTNVFSNNFFHLLIELVPSLLQVLPLLNQDPTIPILVNREIFSLELFRVVGIDERKLHFYQIRRDDTNTFIFGKVVHFPILPVCHYSPKKLWASIRSNFLNKYGPMIIGRPFLQRALVNDLNIVFVNRNSKERVLDGFAIIAQAIREIVKPKELVIYETETLENTIQIFQKAHILLGVHGAGLSNMIFLHPASVVVEIMPNDYTNYCFHELASSVSLPHMIIPAIGGKTTNTTVNTEDVINGLFSAIEMIRVMEGERNTWEGA